MSKIILLLYLISLIYSKGPYKIEDNVLVLTEKTFGNALREYKYLTVLFYDPGCPHCKNFMPTYHDIASKLKEENLVFAKIDCLKNEKIETIYEIEAFPTLMLIKGEERITFSGKRNLEEIKQWLEENTWPEFIKLNNKKELDNFTINRLCMVYFGNNDSTKNEFIKAERKFETMPLGLVTDEALIKSEAPTDEKDPNKEYKDYINLYKTFGDKKNTLKESLTSENIYKFVYINSYPDVIEFSDETAPIIFAKKQPALVIFSLKITADYDRHLNLLKELRPKVDANIRLFICDISKSTMAMQLAQYCGVTLLNLPKVFIIQAESETPKKYEMNVEINQENILNFIELWKEDRLTPFIRSEPVPENNDGEVLKLVGTTFKKEVLENDKDVLVYFVSSWCTKCKEFEPELVKLAVKLKKNNSKLVIATMDATLNDVDEFNIHNFPTIIFYPGNKKDEEPIEMKGRKQSSESLEKFILKHAYNKNPEEEKNQDL